MNNKHRIIAAAATLVFILIVLILQALNGTISSNAQMPKPIKIIEDAPRSLEVRNGSGLPQPVNELLQDAPGTQRTESGQIQQPSSSLLQYLQPNSGQSSFSE